MPGFIGIQEIVLFVVLLLIIFGAKRLPELGRSFGRGMREFKDGVTGRKTRRDIDRRGCANR
jgi:sec-independent protein translocase protein TatA